jgi:hypothetical protein
LRECFVHDALETRGTFVELTCRRLDFTVAFTEELISDVQRDEHGKAKHVARWCGI